MSVEEWFRGDRVVVESVVLPPGEKKNYKFDEPTLIWEATDALLQLTSDGVSTTINKKDRDVTFYESKSSVEVVNLSSTVHKQIVFRILGRPKYTKADLEALQSKSVYSTSVGDKLLFENEYCRVWSFTLGPTESTGVHQHLLDYCYVVYGAGKYFTDLCNLEIYSYDGALLDNVNFHEGSVEYFTVKKGGFNEDGTLDRGLSHYAKNGWTSSSFNEALVEFL
eukprot:TRINITY_DN398_c0_g1_i2.p1 TRINITY_DN398_c0_g1~~TRINITY_DN398_c0_g1_i2.p1  ORF type:complete len:223 (-),score=33.04 TRINITY_DN398_c0_g1_i2:20-688(-)